MLTSPAWQRTGDGMSAEFAAFALVGFLAQLVDGALGMAYGVVSSTVLLGLGVPPASASASIHAAELFTTAASKASHLLHRNIDWRLFRRLVPTGIVGGVLGAYVLTSFDGPAIEPFVTAYLGIMGCIIIARMRSGLPPRFFVHAAEKPATKAAREAMGLTPQPAPAALVVPLGGVGGFFDAVGGGGWGPVVTSSLVGAGGHPRYVVGTVNAAEFLVTFAISAAFVTTLLTGWWNGAVDLAGNAVAIAGLVAGGLLAAPLAGWAARLAPPRALGRAVGALILLLAALQTWRIVT